MTPIEFLVRLAIEAYDRTWPGTEARERMAQAAQIYACAVADAGRE